MRAAARILLTSDNSEIFWEVPRPGRARAGYQQVYHSPTGFYGGRVFLLRLPADDTVTARSASLKGNNSSDSQSCCFGREEGQWETENTDSEVIRIPTARKSDQAGPRHRSPTSLVLEHRTCREVIHLFAVLNAAISFRLIRIIPDDAAAAGLSSTAASSALILSRRLPWSAAVRSMTASPRKTRTTTANYSNRASPSSAKQLRAHRDLTTPARPSRIFSRTRIGLAVRSFKPY